MNRKQIIKLNQISELYTFNLGGFEQKVLIEGRTKDLPVLISLHGGPGNPIPFSAGCRGLFPQFTDKFLMVYWDQLGCGINNYVIDDSFSIESFVQMTMDLIGEVKKLFPGNKCYLFATSWGSILSAKAVEENPDIIDGAVVCGQLVKDVFFNDEVKETLRSANIPQKKMAQIEKANADNYKPDDLQTISMCLQKYTNAYMNKNGKKVPMGKMILGLMTSPDYTFADFKAVVLNGYRGNNSIWQEILKMDLSPILSRVKIPYIIYQGDTDIVASTKLVEQLVKDASNPNLQYKVIADMGHYPGADMMEGIYEEFVAMSDTD